jgi:uroporphyrinogen-III synthase
VGIEIQADADRETEGLIQDILRRQIRYAIFMTGPGVYRLMSTAEHLGVGQEVVEVLNRTQVIARSQKPQKVLEKYGIRVSLVPADNTAEGIAAEMVKRDVQGKEVAVLWHGNSHPGLREILHRQGATVCEAVTYRYSLELEERGAAVLAAVGFKSLPPEEQRILELIHDLRQGKIDVITFTSPPSARNLFALAAAHGLDEDLRRSLNEQVLVIAVGPPTRQAIEEQYVGVDVMPDVYKLGPMMRATVDYLSRAPSGARKGTFARTRSGSAANEQA